MSLRNTTDFDNWRLSRIEEEMERLSFSSEQDTSADDGSCSPRSAEGTLERGSGGRYPKSYVSAMGGGGAMKDDEIYSRAVNSLQREEENKEALRFIKEKYDSLGKVKVKKPAIDPSNQDVMTAPNQPTLTYAPTAAAVANVNVNHSWLVESSQPFPCQQQQQQAMQIVHHALPSFEIQPPPPGSFDPPPAASSSSDHRRTFSADLRPSPSSSVQPSCSPSSGSSPGRRSTSPCSITEEELLQVEMFYRSHKTSVFVGLCQVSLFLGDAPKKNALCSISHPSGGRPGAGGGSSQGHPESAHNWTFVKSGIPVLVLDTGESRRQRRLHVVLAERGTGFGVWRDSIDHLSDYASPSVNFHTMHLSNDHTKLIGLRFEDEPSAAEFLQHIRRLTSNADDPLLNIAVDDKSSKKAAKKTAAAEAKKHGAGKGASLISKADISQPCCFTHVTKLNRTDGSSLLKGGQAVVVAQESSSSVTGTKNSPRPGSAGTAGDRHKVKLKP